MPPSPIGPADARRVTLDLLGVCPRPAWPARARYPLSAVLAITVCAVLAGPGQVVRRDRGLGFGVEHLERFGLAKAPVESTMRKPCARLDAAALDAALAVFAWRRLRQIAGRRVIAIDGKTVRGACSAAPRHRI